MAQAIGLQSHIWKNNRRSIILLVSYPLTIMAIVWACAFLIGCDPSVRMHYARAMISDGMVVSGDFSPANFAWDIVMDFWPLVLTVVCIWFATAYFFHTRMIRSLAKSHPVTRREEPELYNLLENLCIAQGVPMPHLEIIETHARNAFASGIDRKSYAITVTRGLLNSLKKDEVEAVLAHELTHILNRDVRLLIITIIFTGMIGFLAQSVWNSLRYSGHRSRGNGVVIIFGITIILSIGYMATMFTRFAISRSREYMADAGAIEMTKNPDAMMRALKRIADRAQIPETTADIAMMCIENKKAFLGLFATHPPIEERIAAISGTTNTPIPEISGAPAGKRDSFGDFDKPKDPWLIQRRH